jgi:hypothetical protein
LFVEVAAAASVAAAARSASAAEGARIGGREEDIIWNFIALSPDFSRPTGLDC